jgi:hypothetical protein
VSDAHVPGSPETSPIWAKWISPETLLSQVWNTAAFLQTRVPKTGPGRLIVLGEGPDGFLRILAAASHLRPEKLSPEEQLQDYFALCLACHHATVATYVPTDVDSKIRGLLWRETRDPEVLRPMLSLALQARRWTLDGISTRLVRGLSGHDGEHWSVMAGALGRFLELEDQNAAAEARAAIDEEIAREETIFAQTVAEEGAEIDLLKIAMSIAHNRGDLTQGISFWKKSPATIPVMDDLSRRGRFAHAVRMYEQTGMSAEGHRHYPLRPVKALRRSPETLLPLSPFLDDWGAAVIRLDERHEVMEALLTGCRKIEGQQGYFRALAGMKQADPRAFELGAREMSNSAQRYLREADVRKRIDVPRASFESMMRKRARAAI